MRLILLAGTVVLGLYLLFFHRLAARDLWSSHEARAAMDAQTLLDSGDWGMPALYDGTRELQKPPLYYWLVAAFATIGGGSVDAWSVRLPAALSALLCLLLPVGLGYRCGRLRSGVAGAVILATSLHFVTLARTGRIDMPLTFTVSAAIVSFHLARKTAPSRQRFGLLLGGYAALAAGLLLKGPIALVLPAAVLLVQAVVERRWDSLGFWWGIPLVLALTIPWFAWADARTDGEFTQVFFWYHNVQRGLGGSRLRSYPWWFYGPQLAWKFLPWSLLLPVAGWWCVTRKAWREDAELRLGLIWLVTVLALLSCARFKRTDYLLPAFPGAALFLGCVMTRKYSVLSTQYSVRLLTAAVAVLCCLGWLIYVEWILPREEPQHEFQRFAHVIRGLAPQPDAVTLFRTEAHPLAFHLGRPLAILVEWQHLADRLSRPGCSYVVMPPECVEECRQRLPAVRLEETLRNTTLAGGRHDRPLVLLRCDRSSSK